MQQNSSAAASASESTAARYTVRTERVPSVRERIGTEPELQDLPLGAFAALDVEGVVGCNESFHPHVFAPREVVASIHPCEIGQLCPQNKWRETRSRTTIRPRLHAKVRKEE